MAHFLSRGTGRRRAAALFALSSAGVVVGIGIPVFAQQTGDAGVTMRIDAETELRFNDNLGLDPQSQGDSTTWDTRLGFEMISRTQNSRLSFSGSGVQRVAEFPDGSEKGFEDPRLSLSYELSSATSLFTFGATIQQSDLRFLDPISDPVRAEGGSSIGDQDLGPVTGEREVRGYRTGIETGIGEPLGFSLSASRREVTYTDTNNSKYYDNTNDRASAGLRLQLSPVWTGQLSGDVGRYEADNAVGTLRDSRNLSFGLSRSFTDSTLSGRLGYGLIDKTEDGLFGRETDRTSGATGGLTYSRTLPRGSISVDYSRQIETNGGRDTVMLQRALSLPGGELSGGVGATRSGSGDPSVIANLAWEQDLARGRRVLSVARSARTNDDDEDVVITRLGFLWTQDLNAANGLAFNASYAATEIDVPAGLPEDKSQRANLSLAWTRDLTREVEMALGYEHRWLNDSDETGTADSNSVFLRLGRSFTFRP